MSAAGRRAGPTAPGLEHRQRRAQLVRCVTHKALLMRQQARQALPSPRSWRLSAAEARAAPRGGEWATSPGAGLQFAAEAGVPGSVARCTTSTTMAAITATSRAWRTRVATGFAAPRHGAAPASRPPWITAMVRPGPATGCKAQPPRAPVGRGSGVVEVHQRRVGGAGGQLPRQKGSSAKPRPARPARWTRGRTCGFGCPSRNLPRAE